MNHVMEYLSQAIKDRNPVVLATVVEAVGASPVKAGAQLLLFSDGETVGTVGGGLLEAAILNDAEEVMRKQEPRLTHYTLQEKGQDAIGSLCGGEIRVFLQPISPFPKLVIVGGGHIGRPLRAMGEAAGFEMVVVDVEPGIASVPALDAVKLDEHSFIVLITTDHVSDEAALRKVIETPVGYIGMIGSLAKCRTIMEHLREDGYQERALERVYAPIGLNLGGTTPGEIAVAILAEIIAVRRGILDDRKSVSIRRLDWISQAPSEERRSS